MRAMESSGSFQRQVLTTLLLSIAGVMLVALVLSALLLRFTLQREFETRLRTTAQDLQATVTRGRDGAIDLGDFTPDMAFSERYSGWYWLVSDGNAVVARSRSLVAESLPIGGVGETRPMEGPRGESLVALALPVRGENDLSITVAGPRAPSTGRSQRSLDRRGQRRDAGTDVDARRLVAGEPRAQAASTPC